MMMMMMMLKSTDLVIFEILKPVSCNIFINAAFLLSIQYPSYHILSTGAYRYLHKGVVWRVLVTKKVLTPVQKLTGLTPESGLSWTVLQSSSANRKSPYEGFRISCDTSCIHSLQMRHSDITTLCWIFSDRCWRCCCSHNCHSVFITGLRELLELAAWAGCCIYHGLTVLWFMPFS